jgi:SIR2-like protein
MVEPPYGIIARRLAAGQVVPFLGAGASLAGRPAGTAWTPDNKTLLPSGLDLAHFLAGEAEFPSDDPSDVNDLAKVSSYYAAVAGRRALRERLRDVLKHDYEPTGLHRFLASISVPIVLVVTNYDTLAEQAFRAAGKPYDLIVYPADRPDIANAVLWWRHGETEPRVITANELDINLETTNVIYKMHGTVMPATEKWDNFVITEEDYVEFLSRMTSGLAVPSLFYPYFRERSFLFLGYSLRDWNLRVVLRNLAKYLARRTAEEDDDLPSWAIQRNPSELERRLWSTRNVNIFNVELGQFVERLSERRPG